MAKREILVGSTDQTIDIFISDSSSVTGAGLAGLAFDSAGLVCYYRKGATGTPTALSLATQTVGGAHSDGGFVEVDATNCPGQYRLDLSDTIVASAGIATLYLRGATNMVPCLVELEVVAVNKYDAVRMGMTALPNANADAAGGLPISDAGGLDLDARLDAAVSSRMATYTQPTGFLAATFPGTVSSYAGGAVASVTGNVGGNVVGSVGSVTGLTNATIAAAVEAAILNEGDATALLAAIAAKVEDFILADGDSRATLAAIGAAVWANATRTLSAGTNIVLAKGTGVTGFNDPTAAAIRAEMDSNSTKLADIVADTNELQTDNADGGRTDLLVDGIKAKTDLIPASPASTTNITAAAGITLADGAITDAKFTIPTLTAPATGVVGFITQLWRRTFKKATKTATQIKTYADDGTTVVTTQTISSVGANQDQGAAS